MLSFSRRRALQWLGAGAVGCVSRAAWSQTPAPPVLSGNSLDLVIDEGWVDVDGQRLRATLINGCYPAPTLRFTEGDTVRIRVHNRLAVPTALHWHGLLVPSAMDGVPHISFDGIAAGGSFEYCFRLQQHGTYWYHAHAAFQEQTGLVGALIIDPAQPDAAPMPEHTVLLSDWSMQDPASLMRRLQVHSEFDQQTRSTLQQWWQDAAQHGWSQALAKRQMWQQMRMSDRDFSDLSRSLRYSMNGCFGTAESRWFGRIQVGQPTRLRLINASAQSLFDVRVVDLPMQVVAADGLAVEPVTVDELRLGAGETYDVLIVPQQAAYTVFAQTIDRCGAVAGILAEAAHLRPAVPAIDPAEGLQMQDMMGDMLQQHASQHAHSEYGASVDMRVDWPRRNLDDVGVNLRHHQHRYGRRVLSYADLHSRNDAESLREPDLQFELHLTGNMHRYQWGMDGLSFAQARPIMLRAGQRVRVRLHNDSMMTHPMHLHGMWSDVQQPSGGLQVRKHTVLLQPAQAIDLDFSAIAGRWAWHCHLLYHMHAGMMREVWVQ